MFSFRFVSLLWPFDLYLYVCVWALGGAFDYFVCVFFLRGSVWRKMGNKFLGFHFQLAPPWQSYGVSLVFFHVITKMSLFKLYQQVTDWLFFSTYRGSMWAPPPHLYLGWILKQGWGVTTAVTATLECFLLLI